MSKATRATRALERLGISFTLHQYDYRPGEGPKGLQAAEALAESPDRVLKTLMTLVDGKPVCAVVPSNREVSMKLLAAAMRAKSAHMMAPAEAERLSGYVVGGISPFGQKRVVPVVMEKQALGHERVFINGGQRGLQVRLSPEAAAKALNAVVADLVSTR